MNRAMRRSHAKNRREKAKRLAKARHLYQDKGRDTRVTRQCRCSWCAPQREFDGLTLAERRACDAAHDALDEMIACDKMARALNPPKDDWIIHGLDAYGDGQTHYWDTQLILDEVSTLTREQINRVYDTMLNGIVNEPRDRSKSLDAGKFWHTFVESYRGGK